MDQEITAKGMLEQGIDAYRIGEYEESLEAFQQARKLSAGAGDREGEIEALGSMGVVYVELEQWDDAGRFLEEALGIGEETGDKLNTAKILGNLGMMHARQGEVESATEAYQQAIALFQELGETAYEKDISRQLTKLGTESKLADALDGVREGLAYRWEATGVPMAARKLFQLFGRQSGQTTAELEDAEEGDVIDLHPEADEE
jgi:tetratricopeptide (TPR) repeat protein